MKEALTLISGDEVSSNEFPKLISDFGKKLDDLVIRREIRGKAAHFSKTTLERIANPDTDKKQKAEGSQASELITIFKETQRISETPGALDDKLTQEMIKSTVAYRSGMDGSLLALASNQRIARPSAVSPSVQMTTQYGIVDLDSFVAAKNLIDSGLNPLVINAANAVSIGGGVEDGTSAQEESLFRCSNYYRALYPHGKLVSSGRHQGRHHYTYSIAEFGSYYTPSVQVFRDSMKQYEQIKPFSVACIAVAGYDLGKPQSIKNNLTDKTGSELLNDFKKFTKVKIEHLLEVALLHGHDSVILPALSCGAFRLPGDQTGQTAEIVAAAYKEVLEQPRYQGRFKNITFGVLAMGKIGKINFDVFQRMVDNLQRSVGPRNVTVSHSGSTFSSSPSSSTGVLGYSSSPLQFSNFSGSTSTASYIGLTDVKSEGEVRQLKETNSESAKVFSILERTYRLFENVPRGISVENAKSVVMSMLRDRYENSDEEDSLSDEFFFEDLGVFGDKNKEKMALEFRQTFLDIVREIENSKSKPPLQFSNFSGSTTSTISYTGVTDVKSQDEIQQLREIDSKSFKMFCSLRQRSTLFEDLPLGVSIENAEKAVMNALRDIYENPDEGDSLSYQWFIEDLGMSGDKNKEAAAMKFIEKFLDAVNKIEKSNNRHT